MDRDMIRMNRDMIRKHTFGKVKLEGDELRIQEGKKQTLINFFLAANQTEKQTLIYRILAESDSLQKQLSRDNFKHADFLQDLHTSVVDYYKEHPEEQDSETEGYSYSIVKGGLFFCSLNGEEIIIDLPSSASKGNSSGFPDEATTHHLAQATDDLRQVAQATDDLRQVAQTTDDLCQELSTMKLSKAISEQHSTKTEMNIYNEIIALMHQPSNSERNDKIINRLKKEKKINSEFGCRGTPLWWAARANDTFLIKQLIANGADINQVMRDDCTVLGVAIYACPYKTVQALLDNGVKIRKELVSILAIITSFNKTHPAYNSTIDTMKVLLAGGAPVVVDNKEWGITPMQVVNSCQDQEVKKDIIALMSEAISIDRDRRQGHAGPRRSLLFAFTEVDKGVNQQQLAAINNITKQKLGIDLDEWLCETWIP